MDYNTITHVITWNIPEIIGYFLPSLAIGIFLYFVWDNIQIIKDRLDTLVLRNTKPDESNNRHNDDDK